MEQEKSVDMPPTEDRISVASSPVEPHPAGKVRYGGIRQLTRLCSFCSYFVGCILVILCTQFIGAPLYLFNKPTYYSYMARTKQHFGVLVTTITQWWSPTVVRVTGDRSVRHQLERTPDGRLECHFPERLILIANHQLYSDWLYLWWIAYTARMHGFLYIILKESLKYIPLLGVGMQFYGFIFLARKWEHDKPRFIHRLSKLASGGQDSPMWLLIFPEGTNLSDNGRKTSAKYAKKVGVEDMRHLLLPRATGLRFCLDQLQNSVEWVYDCTVAYEGVPRGKFGQDYFTLYSTYFQGRPPKSVNMHWRRFPVQSIPITVPEEFDVWLRARWAEKDDLLEYFVQNGSFPEDDPNEPTGSGYDMKTGSHHKVKLGGQERLLKKSGGSNSVGKWEGPVETEVRVAQWTDIADIFLVLLMLALMVNVCLKTSALIPLGAGAFGSVSQVANS